MTFWSHNWFGDPSFMVGVAWALSLANVIIFVVNYRTSRRYKRMCLEIDVFKTAYKEAFNRIYGKFSHTDHPPPSTSAHEE